ncbi:hypothetical protein D3227_37920, partial [Mesorhizobium waimense]
TFAASTIAGKRRALERSLDDIFATTTSCDLARDIQNKFRRARDQLLTFAQRPGMVDATNNACERALRCGRWTRTLAAIAWPPTQRCRIVGMLAAHLPGHVACVVNTSNSSMAREPPFWSGWRHSVFEIGADWQRTSRPSVAMPRSHDG